jgi:heptosyltransferase-2
MFVAAPPKITHGIHAAVQLARPLEQLGPTLRDPAARLFPSEEDRAFARGFVGDPTAPVAVHPGSGSAMKNWPIERWKALLAQPHDEERFIIGGEADERQLRLLRAVGARFAVNLALPHLAAVLERCGLFIGHDSGIAHIAAAVGTPCLLLFGPTDPGVWAPANENVRVIRTASGNLNDISVEQVLDALAEAQATS